MTIATQRLSWWELIKETFHEWNADNVSTLAAALSYYAVFSIAPLLVIVVAVVGFALGPAAAQGELKAQVDQLVGPAAGAFLLQMIAKAGNRSSGIAATVISTAILLYAATNVFSALQVALNRIWNVTVRPDLSWGRYLFNRLWMFSMVGFLAIIFLASLIASTALSFVQGAIGGVPASVWQGANLVASLLVFTLLFALIFKYLPDVKVWWRDAFLGGAVTAALFTAGKWALGYYLSRPSTTSIYGAAGSLVVLLLFIYYSSLILFFGAEFTQVYTRRSGRPIAPTRDAVALDTPLPELTDRPPPKGPHRTAEPPQHRGRESPAPQAAQARAQQPVLLTPWLEPRRESRWGGRR